jgi:hypothetical protein
VIESGEESVIVTNVANFAGYLAGLFLRASEAVEFEVPHVMGRVSEHLAS